MDIRQSGLRFGRRATDDTFRAFHQACDANDLQTAGDLLLILEDKFSPHLERGRVQGEHLRALLQAQARLWSLRCRSFGDGEEAAYVHVRDPSFELPPTSKLTHWLATWLRGPKSPFAAAAEFSIKG